MEGGTKLIHKYLRHDKKFPHVWCPGCGIGIMLGALIRATLESDNHKWFIGKMTTEEKVRRAKQREEFAKRYVAKPQIRRRALPSARVMPAGGRAASRAPSS